MSREDSMRILRKFFVDIFLISGCFVVAFEVGFFFIRFIYTHSLFVSVLLLFIEEFRHLKPKMNQIPPDFNIIMVVLCIYATNNLWVPFERGFFCDDESLMFPYRSDTVTTPMLRIFGLGLPILAFFLCEWVLLRKEADDQRVLSICVPAWLRGFYCPLASFAFGTCFIELTTNVAKNVIGRPRPHFFDLCKPSIDCSLPEWQRRYVQPNEYHCTGEQTDKFVDMHMSFLSGHSAWSAFTMFYLALYLEKRMVWRDTRVLRHVLQFVAVMLSWFTALSRVSDYKHHWSDVLAGYFLGMTFAVLIWTWGTDILEPKRKHQPVPQHELTSINHGQIAAPA